jgi:hypothetical protein
MKQAEWNDITWGHTGSQIANIKSLRLSQSVKTEENKSSSGENKTVIKGLENEELSITYAAGFPVGLDPRGEFEMLKKCVGMQDQFLLSGEPITETNFELSSVELSNTKISSMGLIITADLTLNFNTEKEPSSKGGKGSKKSGKSKKGTKKSSLTLSPSDIAKAKNLKY